ncbi:hypothetical protein Cri9333_0646 [Crinalium epipsammum PCC 9333]|uniref:Uncharacterized protein n=1 Tax=Crinalium epipsammum PCC 9333 TaxID=1173022 RepID=K9VU22_9CYAN|nr:hypothetical protein [Crinalium epipsammum]AFZ11588.1 hypothetical protein Cri9333_0646 [Crinalium epipsammum PCC 9333]
MKYFHHVLNGTKERAGVPQFQIYQKLNPSQSQLDAAIVLASQQGFIKINALSIVRKGIEVDLDGAMLTTAYLEISQKGN